MREDRGWSQQRAFEELRFGLQFGPKSRASYRALDIGTRIPTILEQEFFVSYFGKSPDDLPDLVEPTEPADALVAALTRQAAAIEALVGELQKEREDGRDVATAFDRAATHLLQALRPGGIGG
jgi:5'-deoxynucleotidase YfbR-like HD superfamily hydrolase